jgi:hypothetical protein
LRRALGECHAVAAVVASGAGTMSSVILPIKHLVLELRYDPTLQFYPVMDKIGLEYVDAYPDWERSPLTIELRDKKTRRRFFLSAARSFYEALDFSSEGPEFDRAVSLFDRLHHELKFTKVRRVGIRRWVAVSEADPFPKLVAAFSSRFAPKDERFEQILRGRTEDLGLLVDVRTENGWKYHLRAGPMERKQWFEVIPHEAGLFDSGKDFEAYKEKIPERMFYIDFDGYQEDLAYSDLGNVVGSIRRGGAEIIEDLIRYLKG